ncbi:MULTISPECIES: DUF3732 domain-containing protein [Burkholderia]|uniref:DUF3732 domain-containing protein n=1 Tax=Burkholderia aenigmatica TaxID=2015348 RepID=A0A6J5JTP8_9BURK|nr:MULTISPECIES: DUF3732 domain-containing protein [Burkholderia]CAB3974547.1 hypothetical protein BLA3211_08067 [Burkholderia aenigmatica]
MKLQIIELILWPRKAGIAPQVVPFERNKANIITGASKTGKSSIIPIIDYCLASERCAIPVGVIRKAVAWFGIVVDTDEGLMLLARPEPGRQPTSTDMYVKPVTEGATPLDVPVANTNVDRVKLTMDRLARLTRLGTDAQNTTSGYAGRPSFRDLMAFCFQPQNLVANPDVLFYRADTTEHREKLRAIFPYVLGVTTPEILEKQWEYESLRRAVRVLEKELAAYERASATWRANLGNWVTEAYELGFLPVDSLKDAEEPAILEALSGLTAANLPDSIPSAEVIAKAADEYGQLTNQEAQLNAEIAEVRHRMSRLSDLRSSVNQFELSLGTRQERLGLSRWLRVHTEETVDAACPVCSQSLDGHAEKVETLVDALVVVESEARRVARAPSVYDRDWVALEKKLRELVDALGAVAATRKGIEARNQRARQQRLLVTQAARFIGALEQALEVYKGRESSASRDELDKMLARIEQLKAELSGHSYHARLERVQTRLTRWMGRIAENLDAEDEDAAVQLDMKELTVKVSNENGGSDYLWQLGSGANWLTYHVSALLALHLLFSREQHSPVPGLLVFDQPSQVYFPRRLTDGSIEENYKVPDEDSDAVKRFFKTFGAAASTYKGHLQIIVLDHAGHQFWDGQRGIHFVQEWRNGVKLVPTSWLEDGESAGHDGE